MSHSSVDIKQPANSGEDTIENNSKWVHPPIEVGEKVFTNGVGNQVYHHLKTKSIYKKL